MRHALVPQWEDELTEPTAQILWLDRGQLREAPPPAPVPLHRVPPAGWYADQLRFWDGRDWTDDVRPIQRPTSVMRVAYEEGPGSEPAPEARRLEPTTVGPTEVGLLGLPPATVERQASVPTSNAHRGLRWTMRPFARRRRTEMVVVEKLDERDLLDNLLDEGKPPMDDEPDSSDASRVTPATNSGSGQEQAAAAWFPDPNDPNAIRFWDGSRWTELVTPKPPPLASLDTPTATAASHQVETAPPLTGIGEVAMDEASGWHPDPFGLHEGRYFDHGQPTNRVRDGSQFFYDEVPADGSHVTTPAVPDATVTAPQVPTAWDERTPPPPPAASARVVPTLNVLPTPPEATEDCSWAEKAQIASARAREMNTPESWSEAAQAAAVLSEMTQVMLVTAKAEHTAEQMKQAAHAAAEAAATAKQSAERTAQAADEAARVARAAADAAAIAKQSAERTARAAPEAAQAAAAATHRALAVKEAVARAQAADTPEAWSDASQFVAAEIGDVDSD